MTVKKSAAPAPKVGFTFLHARVLDADNEPQPYRVTRIAEGHVHYRPIYADGGTGSPDCCPVQDFPQYVLQPPTLCQCRRCNFPHKRIPSCSVVGGEAAQPSKGAQ